jgi:hypothetical protein
MTVCHNGVPVEDIELELFKFVAHFINEYDLPENVINDEHILSSIAIFGSQSPFNPSTCFHNLEYFLPLENSGDISFSTTYEGKL